MTLTAELHPRPKLSMFCTISQNYHHFVFLKIYKYLKAICLRNSKWHWYFSRPCKRFTSHWSKRLPQDANNFFSKNCWLFWVNAQSMLNFSLGCNSPLNIPPLTAHNWQKWKRVFLTCPCRTIYRDEAVGLKSCKYTWKSTIFVKMWNLGQYRENLIFCQ